MRLLLAGSLLAACSPGGRGALEPVAGPGVVLASTQGLSDDTARLDTDGVRADVTGAWSNTGPSLDIVYQAENAPVTIPVATRVRWKGRSVPASAVWDQTVPVPGSVMGQALLNTAGLKIPAHARRKVQILYDVPKSVEPPAYGDELTVDIPMPGGVRPATFKAGAE